MTPDFMRLVDKWLGVPLCLMLSAVERLLRPFARNVSPDQAQKILIVQISERGAVILAHSALCKLKDLFPQAEISYLIFEEMKESITLLGSIPESRIFTIPSASPSGFVACMLKTIGALRREKFDAVLDLDLFSRLSAMISFL